MADASMLVNPAAQAAAIWPQEEPLLARYALPLHAWIADGARPGQCCGIGGEQVALEPARSRSAPIACTAAFRFPRTVVARAIPQYGHELNTSGDASMIVTTCLAKRERRAASIGCKMALATATASAAIALAAATFAQPPASAAAPRPTVPIKQLMETTITDASNTIWGAYDPPTSAEQWAALEKAALALIEATKVNAVGGTGPMDNEWVKQPAWKPFNDAMLQASEAALAAIRAKDHDALLAAGDVLYPPCEGCHLQFNPGVVNQN
jgi:hypothetical protein